jgi:hypothetical protein
MDDKENERTTDKSIENIQDINTCNVNILQENSTSNASISQESLANTSTSFLC